ncbi:AAA family ATPase [Hymenobacter sp. BT770]|uniref:ParA family protein n=1 Tax=Hymenobacter sp. BT770 TaxID=2886942 RepID=UPI001D0F5880|nr:AAA family ATPase [Hymenobacter sp. BT770]MCC3155222.1 AAA family ATPase [Hymenobacter sp. BT770]MDO3417177.1 AAA family ATPase [Hymenobacter sp. BT770]
MPFEHHAAYLALRTYLGSLLAASTDQAFSDIPAALRPNLAVFLAGQPAYPNSAGQRMVCAADLDPQANLTKGLGR